MSASAPARAKRVLVIGEDSVDRVRIQSALTEAGYEADTALDDMHAAELAMLRDYALVVASPRIPALGGRLSLVPVMDWDSSTDSVSAVAARLGPPASAAALLIDRGQLERLRAQTDDDLFLKLLSDYLQGSRDRLARIEASLAREDLVALARDAHDLKGTSATFGALRLRDRAGELERVAKSEDLAAARAAFPDIRIAAEACLPLFERELAAIS